MGSGNCSMFCCALLCATSFSIILMEKRELAALLSLSSWSRDCCVTLPRGALDLSAVCNCGIS